MFGVSAIAQSPFASLGGTNRIQYANNGTYSYTGIATTLLNSKYLEATNGTYSYIGSNAMVNINTKIFAENGAYTINGQTSTNKLYLGDWEFEFGAVDVWTCQDEGATATWTIETTTPITWN